MAHERSYRHDARCRHCDSNWMLKDGRTSGRAADNRCVNDSA